MSWRRVGTVLVVWFGIQAVWSGRLSLGGVVVFLGYLGALYSPIQALSRLTGTVQRARVGAERVVEVLDAEPAFQERHGARTMPTVRGLVEFHAVSFGYAPDRSVLRGFELTIRPGEMVALVGASGVGKTTVVSLLLNYYDVTGGVVAIDGEDVRQFDPPSVRKQIAAVLQEPLRGGALGQHRGQRAERPRRPRLTRTLFPARTAQMHGPEQRAHDNGVHILVSSRSATVGTRHLLGQAGAYLLIDEHVLDTSQQILRFSQLQAERVDRQHIAVDLRYLDHHWRGLVIFVVGFDNDLHSDLHARALA